MSTVSDLRPSPIAGTWYPGDPEQLGRQVDEYLAQAEALKLDGEVVALVAPHAGYAYSGRTAGYAFRTVQGQRREVVAVAAPFHAGHPRPVLTSAHRAYDTPLGQVPIDREAVEALTQALEADGGPGLAPVANDREHALEIELPFLQRALEGDFLLLPVMVTTYNSQELQRLGKALAGVLKDRSALLVASTDLSHFKDQSLAHELDAEMMKQITSLSPEGVLEAQRTGRGLACGAAGVAAVLWAALELGANQAVKLHYSTSGETTGDLDSVVGYGAAVVLKNE